MRQLCDQRSLTRKITYKDIKISQTVANIGDPLASCMRVKDFGKLCLSELDIEHRIPGQLRSPRERSWYVSIFAQTLLK